MKSDTLASLSSQTKLKVSRISNLCDFDKLKPVWNIVHSADPNAHVFLSWEWLRGWFSSTPSDWFVLAIQRSDTLDYVGFFPLSVLVKKEYGLRLRQLCMGGNPLADYTGFICLPVYEAVAIEIFAHYVQHQLEWDIFHLDDALDPRLENFLAYFSPQKFNVWTTRTLSCPLIPLPKSWDNYLKNYLGTRTRESLRRRMKKIEQHENYYLTHIQEHNLESQINTLLSLAESRWGKMSVDRKKQFQSIFYSTFQGNSLWLTVLWDKTTPVAAMAAFIDRQRKTFSYYISGFDPHFSRISPGRFMVGYSIKYAIENGFEVYDFLRGDEAYKFTFGSKPRHNISTIVTRNQLRLATLNFSIAFTLRAKRIKRGIKHFLSH